MRLNQKVKYPLTDLLPNKSKLVSFSKSDTKYFGLKLFDYSIKIAKILRGLFPLNQKTS
jgi:hypothetical protein